MGYQASCASVSPSAQGSHKHVSMQLDASAFFLSIAQGLHIGGGASGEVMLFPSDYRYPSHQESPMNFFVAVRFGLVFVS